MKKLYWLFHAILFLAFAATILGFAIPPSGFWDYTVQTGPGPIIFAGSQFHVGVYHPWGEMTAAIGLYTIVAFNAAAVLFVIAATLGLRLIGPHHQHEP